METMVMATMSSTSVTPRWRCCRGAVCGAHGYCTCTKPLPASIVILRAPTVTVVPGLLARRPWVSNW